MTTPARPPLWVSIEGINGVGKTTAARAAAAMLGTRCLLLDELTDSSSSLPGLVIAALSVGGDPFLRTGHPVVETLALLALQVRKAEHLARQDMTGVEVILEDRGVDSVAVYQAAILCSQHPETQLEAVMWHVLSTIRPWRAFPDVTILLTSDPAICAARFAVRTGHPLTPQDISMIEQIDALYRAAAAADPGRYIVADVSGLSPQETAETVGAIVTSQLNQETAHAS